MIEVREYLDRNGRSPYAEWFDDLDAPAAAKVTVAVTRMSQGNLSNVKGVGSGVFEYIGSILDQVIASTSEKTASGL